MSVNSRSVCASAPGKVILFGEHAVVYGEPAVAAALDDLRIHVLITPIVNNNTSSGSINILMPDLEIDVSLPSSKLLRLTKLQTPPTQDCVQQIRHVIEESLMLQRGQDATALTFSALTPLLYLLNQLAPPNIVLNGIEICVRSGLPVGAGLGSSAAFGVATAAALVQLATQSDDTSATTTSTLTTTPPSRPDAQLMKTIDQYAYYSEILMHGTPSGIDNAVSAFGGAVLFTKKTDNVTMERFAEFETLNLLLVSSGVARSTKEQVGKVREMYEKFPKCVPHILSAMGAISIQFVEQMRQTAKGNTSSSTTTNNNRTNDKDLLTLVRTNQHLLSAVGVSHPTLDSICQRVDQVSQGKAAAKLTGAGGGGCLYVLFSQNAKDMPMIVKRALESDGFRCFSSGVGGPGVLWVDPKDFPTQQQDSCSSMCNSTNHGATFAVAEIWRSCRSWWSSRNWLVIPREEVGPCIGLVARATAATLVVIGCCTLAGLDLTLAQRGRSR